MSDQGVSHSNPLKGFLLALASIILLSVTFVTGRYALREINPETLSLGWTTSAAVCAFLFLLLRGFGRELRIPGRLVVPVLVLGLVTGGGMMLFFFRPAPSGPDLCRLSVALPTRRFNHPQLAVSR